MNVNEDTWVLTMIDEEDKETKVPSCVPYQDFRNSPTDKTKSVLVSWK